MFFYYGESSHNNYYPNSIVYHMGLEKRRKIDDWGVQARLQRFEKIIRLLTLAFFCAKIISVRKGKPGESRGRKAIGSNALLRR
jgi:hypothetical protein